MTATSCWSASRRAFTLVEVLAALVLVAIILPVAMRGISLATAAAGEARRRVEAAVLAEARLIDLVATGEWEGANLSGDFSPDWPGYRWKAEVSDWDDPLLRQVSVTVEWTSAGRQRAVTLSTLARVGGQ
jgi:type II secretion system protein I